jgi:hypothetical protein
MLRHIAALAALFSLLAASPLSACTLCTGNVQSAQTLRLEARQAKMVLYGTLTASRLNPGGGGSTDLAVEQVLKDDPARAGRTGITLPKYIPVDPKAPPKFLIFCDVYDGKIDAYRGNPVKGPGVIDYLKGALAGSDADRAASLLYYFRFLDSADPDIATDAFLEFAKANDREIGLTAPRLEPAKLRQLLTDPRTQPERLGLYAYLLGACGTPADADLLAALLAHPTERTAPTLGGQLAGYIRLRPKEGWDLATAILNDPRRPFPDRLAVIGTLRFYHGSHPEEARPQVLRALAVVVQQGELADLAIENLRRWQWWDLTRLVLEQYEMKSHDAPLVKHAIIRYALSCPDAEAKQFIAALRAREREQVEQVEESLKDEKPPGG